MIQLEGIGSHHHHRVVAATTVRYRLVCLTWGWMTYAYLAFHHALHWRKFTFQRHNQTEYTTTGSSTMLQGTNQHSSGDDFEKMLDKLDGNLMCSLTLPLLCLALLSLVWNPRPSDVKTTDGSSPVGGVGKSTSKPNEEVNVTKWTIIWFVIPLYLAMLDGAIGRSHIFQKFSKNGGSDDNHHTTGSTDTASHFHFSPWVRFCNTFLSPSGYAATWALALFLIPVTRHSPILDWLRVTPVQALAFHRISGWVGFWNSCFHGFVHLQHLMVVRNPTGQRTWWQQLEYLLVPPSWACVFTQNPVAIIFGKRSDTSPMDTAGGHQCWLALINATGMISTLAYLMLAVTSLPWVRRYSYQLFYRVHIPAAWIMLVMAIWHYPACALIIIPNIIYYLSFYIPVLVARAFDYRKRFSGTNNNKNVSPLVEANLIQGGSIELVFASGIEHDRRRHESLFVRLFHPSVSPLAHPFSVFSRNALVQQTWCSQPQEGIGSSEASIEILSILLRPSGPFTEGLTKVLFPSAVTGEDDHAEQHDLQLNLADDEQPLVSDSTIAAASPQQHRLLQFDAYYAGSFGWVDMAARSHDKLLLVAGGVGIVPFLDFLPALLQRGAHHQQAASTNTGPTPGYIPVVERGEEATAAVVSPKQIDLHWCCREIGLASHVWHKYLSHHVAVWENSHPGRLTIHVHLTSQNGDESSTRILPNVELVNSQKYAIVQSVNDTTFVQSWWLSLLLPGSLLMIGTALHWYWFNNVTMADAWRTDFLILRAHAILFSLIVFFLISVVVEYMARPNAAITRTVLLEDSAAATPTPTAEEAALNITNGRPAMELVIASILDAENPGVFMCGPQTLMERVETSIRGQRKSCAFYREDSEL